MEIENISANIKLSRKPTTGTEAYNLLIESVKKEIEEKQTILHELQEAETKQEFINNWSPSVKKLMIKELI
jgi:hypothetical protein